MIASAGQARICLPDGIAFGKRTVQWAVNRARLLEVSGDPGPHDFKRILDRTAATVSGAYRYRVARDRCARRRPAEKQASANSAFRLVTCCPSN